MSDVPVPAKADIEQGPTRPELDPDDPKTDLQAGVRAALQALPGEFEFKHTVSGIAATDLFNLNTFLGAGIEMEVVRTLSAMRPIWDPKNKWPGYRFERSNQSFPDVRLVRRDMDGVSIALGVELKGWWLLSKEGVPSLRYQVSPAACAPHDLVCVVPWHLSNAVSGEAVAAEPWVESARFAAEWRDHWWQNIRESDSDTSVKYPNDAAPYPTKAERVTAIPAYDGGNNYGRLPRCRPLMDEFITSSMRVPILGIEAEAWVGFLKLHTDSADPEEVTDRLQRDLKRRDRKLAPETAAKVLALIDKLACLRP